MSDYQPHAYPGDVPVPSFADVTRLTRNPEDNIQIPASILQSVQEFPPPSNYGAWFSQTSRGPILQAYGTKAREAQLRQIYRNDYNSLVQTVVSTIVKKFVTTPWDIEGDKKVKVTIRGPDNRLKTISAIEHYQLVLQNAQFGQGWEVFASMFLEDFLCQDFGAVLEVIGPGDPLDAVDGAITGIAHLDSGRCYITGNPFYPIYYWSLISGNLHKMHASRVARFVDSPSPDERFFGIGLCALSRAIAIANRQMLMNRYIEAMVDDKPKPGVMLWQGITKPQLDVALAAYSRDQQNDARPFWGQTLHMTSVNVDNPISATPINFAQTPEKFNWIEYNSLDVDAVAGAFNIDRQDIWQLQGGNIGSAGQSQVLADKASGKMLGFLFQNFERMINRRVLPREFELQFKRKDADAEDKQAKINLQTAQVVQTLSPVPGVLAPQEARNFLANASDSFKDVLTNEAGQVTAQDAAETEQISLEDANPIDVSGTPAPVAPTAAPLVQPPANGQKPPAQKALKYNPHHDQGNGQFAEGGGSGGGGKPSGSAKPKPSSSGVANATGNMTSEQQQAWIQQMTGQQPKKPKPQAKPKPSEKPNAPTPSEQSGDDTQGHFDLDADHRNATQAQTMSKAAISKLDKEAKTSVNAYSDTAYRPINDCLRKSCNDLDPQHQTHIKQLDKAISSSALPQETMLYRGFGYTPKGMSKMKEGATFSDKGFVSTSMSNRVAETFTKGGAKGSAVMRIRAPKGSKGLPVSAGSKYPEEHEVLLPRDQKFRVTKVSKRNGVTYIDTELVDA